jgi:uncharacterized delta-60 repeat protein
MRLAVHRNAAFLAIVLLISCATSAIGASSTVVVTATVPSATSLNVTLCPNDTSGITNLGTVLPGSTAVTTSNCSLTFGSTNDSSMLRAYQFDQSGTAMALASTGVLDTTFDGDGRLTTAWTGTSIAYAMAIQPDGRMVAAGTSNQGVSPDFAVARYLNDGSLDTSFNGTGKWTMNVNGGADWVRDMVIQPDGKIVVVSSSSGIDVVRLNADGTLDTSFDGDGWAHTALADDGYDVELQADGKIVIAGRETAPDNRFTVVRLNTNGSVDTTFDGDGLAVIDFGAGSDIAYALVVQPDGKLVLGGQAGNGFLDFGLVRLNTNGSLDTSFDGDGKAQISVSAGNDTGQGMVLQPDGKLVLVGSSSVHGVTLLRVNADGSIDTSFSGDGIAYGTGVSGTAWKVTMQPGGNLIVVDTGSSGVSSWRFDTNGNLDTTWGGTGRVTTVITGGGQAWNSLPLPDGRVVVGGYAGGTWAFARYGQGAGVTDWAGSWGAGSLFGVCLHELAGGALPSAWALAGTGNCTTAIDANWNALPTTAVKVAQLAASGTATATLRYGFKPALNQPPGRYMAGITYEVAAPNV